MECSVFFTGSEGNFGKKLCDFEWISWQQWRKIRWSTEARWQQKKIFFWTTWEIFGLFHLLAASWLVLCDRSLLAGCGPLLKSPWRHLGRCWGSDLLPSCCVVNYWSREHQWPLHSNTRRQQIVWRLRSVIYGIDLKIIAAISCKGAWISSWSPVESKSSNFFCSDCMVTCKGSRGSLEVASSFEVLKYWEGVESVSAQL